jgi:tetratricopeptide (TPR) repeat protein
MKKVGTRVENFDKWREQLKSVLELSKTKDFDGVALAKALVETIQLYPEYVGDANAYEYLAKAQLAQKDDKGAAETLTAYASEGGENPDALKQLASLQEEAGNKKEAAATLERLNFIYPEDQGLHSKLGDLLLAEHDYAGAVREYNAVVAMKPLDMASAQYNVARAYYAEGDKAKAEESVLAALEVAPGYKDAQRLLLEIEGK